MSLVWINGQLVDKAEARVSPFDHGFLYGDGVWEPLRAFDGKLFRAADHVRQLFDAAAALDLSIPYSSDELIAAIEVTLRANEREVGYVRIIVSRGTGTLGPDPRKIEAQVFIIAEEYRPFPMELYEHGLHVALAPHPIRTDSVFCHIRTLGQPHVVAAKAMALKQGCLEALLTNPDGVLVGGTEGMLLLVQDGAVIVASGHIADVHGYAVAAMVGEAGLVVAETSIRLPELLAADEAFLVGTSCGVIAIVQVDGKPIGSGTEGPITRQIREAYRRLTRGEE